MLEVIRIAKRLTSLGLVLIAFASVAAATTLIIVPQVGTIATANASTSVDLSLRELAQRSSMYATDGTFLTFLAEEQNREPVELADVPQEVIDAILGMEDADFYEHNGVNVRATFRALIENVNAGGIAQGGSTITQQLVKNAILTSDQNIGRKSTEAFYALRLEDQLTKDEILERYLNTIYFGAGAHGIQSAAEIYFGSDVGELGWEEAALLAGLIRNPSRYDPTQNVESARARRAVVVDRLVALEHVTESEGERLKRAPLPAERQQPNPLKPDDYFVREALEVLLNDPDIPLGDSYTSRYNAVYKTGLKITTTFSPGTQAMALQAREDHLPIDERGFTVAMTSIETHTGAVRAMVGGPEFAREQFNIATQGARQPGSSMKTFVLAALFEAGYTPRDSVRGDSPCTFKNPGGFPNPYKVKGGSWGIQSIASVTRSSNNCAFVRLGQVVGNEQVVKVAKDLGITTDIDAVLSLPLGSKEVYNIDMSAAYAAMANDGVYNEPYYIEKIEDVDGNVIYEHRPDSRRALTQQSARMITEVLESNVRSGTGKAARLSGGHAAGGKTGTTQNYEDAWFVGFTDYLTTAVWMGHPDEKVPMRNVRGWGNMFGGKVPATIFGSFNNAFHENLEAVPFADPERYGGGKYLKVAGEIDFCSRADWNSEVRITILVDTNGDGRGDCFQLETTTTESTTTTTLPPTTLPPPPPPTTAPPVPEPTTTATTAAPAG